MAEPRKKLRRLRKAKGISAADAAQHFGVSEAAWYKWERGNRTPQVGLAIRIAEFLGVSVEDIFGDDASRGNVS